MTATLNAAQPGVNLQPRLTFSWALGTQALNAEPQQLTLMAFGMMFLSRVDLTMEATLQQVWRLSTLPGRARTMPELACVSSSSWIVSDVGCPQCEFSLSRLARQRLHW